MEVPTGDEVCVVGDPIELNQKEARLIEVRWVKTHQVCMMQIEERGRPEGQEAGLLQLHPQKRSLHRDR